MLYWIRLGSTSVWIDCPICQPEIIDTKIKFKNIQNWVEIALETRIYSYLHCDLKFKSFNHLDYKQFDWSNNQKFSSPKNSHFELFHCVLFMVKMHKARRREWETMVKKVWNSYEWDESEWWIWQCDSRNQVNLHFDGKVFVCAINTAGGPCCITRYHSNK